MIRVSHAPRRPRRGAVLPMIAMLLVVFLGILSFAVDLGRVAVCRAQLQNAADSAALAGASALGTSNLILPAQQGSQVLDSASARTLAQTFAQDNGYDLNNSSAVVLDKQADVDVGISSYPITPTSPFVSTGSVPFNSVRVRTWIDSGHGGKLNLLFAPAMNQSTATLQASAIATVELHLIASVKPLPGLRSSILPITMSLSDYQKMVAGQTGQDLLRFDQASGLVLSGPDGLPEQQLYPGSNGTSSNDGLLQFGTSSQSNSVLNDEITNEPSSSELIQQWGPSGSPPWNAQGTFTIGADPGWRAANFDALAQSVGLVRAILINDGTSPGNGANGTYTIVMLAPVRVMASVRGGKGSGQALVQAAVIGNDPTLIPSPGLSPPGAGGIPVVRLTR